MKIIIIVNLYSVILVLHFFFDYFNANTVRYLFAETQLNHLINILGNFDIFKVKSNGKKYFKITFFSFQ